jgi:hypothetical protein
LDQDLRDSLFQRPNDLRNLRFPEHLSRAQSIIIQLLSVQSSWKSLRSGLLCWGDFMSHSIICTSQKHASDLLHLSIGTQDLSGSICLISGWRSDSQEADGTSVRI